MNELLLARAEPARSGFLLGAVAGADRRAAAEAEDVAGAINAALVLPLVVEDVAGAIDMAGAAAGAGVADGVAIHLVGGATGAEGARAAVRGVGGVGGAEPAEERHVSLLSSPKVGTVSNRIIPYFEEIVKSKVTVNL